MAGFNNWSCQIEKAKENFAENPGNNILRLFNVLLNFPFTKSETKRDCQ